MSSANYDLLVEQGQDHRFTLVLQNLDITGYSAEMQIRKHVRSEEMELSLSTSNGKLIIDEINSTIFIVISDQDSFLISNLAAYDLFIESPSGDRKRLINGKVNVNLAVTR